MERRREDAVADAIPHRGRGLLVQVAGMHPLGAVADGNWPAHRPRHLVVHADELRRAQRMPVRDTSKAGPAWQGAGMKERRKDPRATSECNGCSRPVRIPWMLPGGGGAVGAFSPCTTCVPSMAELVRERAAARKIKRRRWRYLVRHPAVAPKRDG